MSGLLAALLLRRLCERKGEHTDAKGAAAELLAVLLSADGASPRARIHAPVTRACARPTSDNAS